MSASIRLDQSKNHTTNARQTCLKPSKTKSPQTTNNPQNLPRRGCAVYLSFAEMEALLGLSSLTVHLYLRLRQRMDRASHISGEVVRHSLDALADFMETRIPRGKGWEVLRPSRKQLLTALANLQKHGLIHDLGQLVFFLPIAAASDSAEAHRSQNSPQKNAGGEGQVRARKNPVKTKAKITMPAKPGTHHHSPNITTKHGATLAQEMAENSAIHAAGLAEGKHLVAAAFVEFSQSTGRKVSYDPESPLLTELANAGQAAVLQALYAAHAARQRDRSPAPLNLPFLRHFLGKNPSHSSIKPSKTAPQHAAPRPAIPLPPIDPTAEAKGRALLAKIAQNRVGRGKAVGRVQRATG